MPITAENLKYSIKLIDFEDPKLEKIQNILKEPEKYFYENDISIDLYNEYIYLTKVMDSDFHKHYKFLNDIGLAVYGIINNTSLRKGLYETFSILFLYITEGKKIFNANNGCFPFYSNIEKDNKVKTIHLIEKIRNISTEDGVEFTNQRDKEIYFKIKSFFRLKEQPDIRKSNINLFQDILDLLALIIGNINHEFEYFKTVKSEFEINNRMKNEIDEISLEYIDLKLSFIQTEYKFLFQLGEMINSYKMNLIKNSNPNKIEGVLSKEEFDKIKKRKKDDDK